jgi:hypothetical protein
MTDLQIVCGDDVLFFWKSATFNHALFLKPYGKPDPHFINALWPYQLTHLNFLCNGSGKHAQSGPSSSAFRSTTGSTEWHLPRVLQRCPERLPCALSATESCGSSPALALGGGLQPCPCPGGGLQPCPWWLPTKCIGQGCVNHRWNGILPFTSRLVLGIHRQSHRSSMFDPLNSTPCKIWSVSSVWSTRKVTLARQSFHSDPRATRFRWIPTTNRSSTPPSCAITCWRGIERHRTSNATAAAPSRNVRAGCETHRHLQSAAPSALQAHTCPFPAFVTVWRRTQPWHAPARLIACAHCR